ncbi:MAG: cysteine desulfurase [Candidatus Melainabacteria bacterium]|nr:MAG: cysteine desulfurase [Candidatus Melainabacteria bacterium]
MVAGKIIYFDNAATSYPKPEVVYQTQDASLRSAGNPGRGAHKLALESAKAVFESRSEIARFLGVDAPERLVFTPGCTYSINTILRGFPFRQSVQRGKELPIVIVSPLEHNAVMRPLGRLEKAGLLRIHRLKYVPEGVIDLQEFKEAVKQLKPVLCVVQEGSNVTGELIDIVSAWEICQQAKVSILVDAAQSAGSVESCLPKLSSSLAATADSGNGFFWCTSGHKGLLGPPGIGLLFIGAGTNIEPLIAGGTGSNSENLEMPANYPDRLESGTQPVHLIDALAKGVSWLKQEGIAKLHQHEIALTDRFLAWCDEHTYVNVFGNRRPRKASSMGRESLLRAGLPIVSFTVDGVSTDRVADLLDREFGIAVRSGLHCAMAAHQSLGTLKTGLTRASFGYFNTADEVDELCTALQAIHKKQGQ